jgi:hypothetical protein
LVSRRYVGSNTTILWIADFALSGDAAGTRDMQATEVTGRVYFQSPELLQYRSGRLAQLQVENPSDKRKVEEDIRRRMPLMQKADMFALGVVIYWVRSLSTFSTKAHRRR